MIRHCPETEVHGVKVRSWKTSLIPTNTLTIWYSWQSAPCFTELCCLRFNRTPRPTGFNFKYIQCWSRPSWGSVPGSRSHRLSQLIRAIADSQNYSCCSFILLHIWCLNEQNLSTYGPRPNYMHTDWCDRSCKRLDLPHFVWASGIGPMDIIELRRSCYVTDQDGHGRSYSLMSTSLYVRRKPHRSQVEVGSKWLDCMFRIRVCSLDLVQSSMIHEWRMDLTLMT